MDPPTQKRKRSPDSTPQVPPTASKKGGTKKPKAKRTKNLDAFHRMNFLLQAAHQTAGSMPATSEHFSRTLKGVSKRLVLRLSPDVKHCMCKKCGTLLIPGTTERIRLHSGKPGWQSSTCIKCGEVRRTVFAREHKEVKRRKKEGKKKT